ncbi:MAG: DMT family transporter [Gammaproteobacteria bacterium]|jgi:drug/metabolite transporter (DMT)-like permease|nr:DMT family transporter [Gammaproteobacteria bacterium]
MSTATAFAGVVMIWSTTPLAIKWSGEGPGFLFGVTGRMVLGTLLCVTLALLLRVRLPLHRRALEAYGAAALGIYGSMMCAYWAAQYVPSGVVAVIFGLAPLTVGALAAWWLDEPSFTAPKILGSLIGIAGLILIFGDMRVVGAYAPLGIAVLLLSVLLHSISSVWVKRVNHDLHALALTSGGLLVALPAYLLTWAILDGSWPEEIPLRAAGSIVYLGVIGSGLGFVLYYYALRRMQASRLALIPLITPLLAMVLGYLLNDERPQTGQLLGAALILSGLVFYEFGERLHAVLRSARMRRDGTPPG